MIILISGQLQDRMLLHWQLEWTVCKFSEKVVVLMEKHHKVGDPHLPQAVVVQLPLFVGIFFSINPAKMIKSLYRKSA